ncbi:hypothetical protein K9N68_35865 (plasmid) [Kovacikia minuta CCNUW1]|uniref:hypothetical protein n=1 Tax=Kovacikia minuta TaxID=2931930 RepID=UPI001CCADC08|nr:hypothetical protein [Kovacikia minuta]UBF30556.1 hypothetical protein K9N68_35865 [Kovacikia minuta CCNUW1]
MAASDSPSSHSQSETEALPAVEPLGLKQPLLPTKPLGVNQQFLVPLGARSLSVLDPTIFSSNLIQADFLDNPFQDSPFFASPDPSIEGNPGAIGIEPNLTSVNPAPASSRSFSSSPSPPSSLSSSVVPKQHQTPEAAPVQTPRSPAGAPDNPFESTALQEIAEPSIHAETPQSNSEAIQLQRSTSLNEVVESTALQESAELSINTEIPQSNSEATQLQRSTSFNEVDRVNNLKPNDPNLSGKDYPNLQSDVTQSSPVEPSLLEGNESSLNAEHSTPNIQTKPIGSISNQAPSLEIQPKGLINATQSQNTERNTIQPKLESSSIDADTEQSIDLPIPASATERFASSEVVVNHSEPSIFSPQQPEISGVADTPGASTIQPKLETYSSETVPGSNNEPSVAALNVSQTPGLPQQGMAPATAPLLRRSPSEQASIEVPDQHFSAPSIQLTPDHSQPASTPELPQGEAALSATQDAQGIFHPEVVQSELSSSSISSGIGDAVESTKSSVPGFTEGLPISQRKEVTPPNAPKGVLGKLLSVREEFSQAPDSQSVAQAQLETESIHFQPSDSSSATTPDEPDTAIVAPSQVENIQQSIQESGSQPEISTTKTQSSTEPSETQRVENKATSTFGIGVESAERNPENPQPSVWKSETNVEFQTAGIQPLSIQRMESEPELQLTTAEATPETLGTYSENARSFVQKGESEPGIQAASETKVNSQLLGLSAESIQPFIQKAEIEPEFLTEPEVEVTSEPVKSDTATIQLSVQTEGKFENQTELKGETNFNSAKVSTPKPGIKQATTQTSDQIYEIEPGTQTTVREVVNSELLEGHTKEIQPSFHKLSDSPDIQPESELGANLAPGELRSENTQLPVPKLDSKLEPQTKEVETISESDKTHSTESQVTEIQASTQRLEVKPEIQRESEGEIKLDSVEVSPTAVPSLDRQPEPKPEIQAASEARVLPESAKVHTANSETRSIDVPTESQGIQPELQPELANKFNSKSIESNLAHIQPDVLGVEAAPEIQTKSEAEIMPDSGEFGTPHPDIQTTDTPAAILRLKNEAGLQEKTAVGATFKPDEIQTGRTQSIFQEPEVEPGTQTAIEAGVISEPAKVTGAESPISTTRIQPTVQKSGIESGLQTGAEVGSQSGLTEVSPADIQAPVQQAGDGVQIKRKLASDTVSESTEPGASATQSQKLGFLESTLQEPGPSKTAPPLPDRPFSAPESNIQTSKIQLPIQESRVEPKIQTIAEAGVAAESVEIQATDRQPAIQKSEFEPGVQSVLEAEVSSESIEIGTENIQPSIQKIEVEPKSEKGTVVDSQPTSVGVRATNHQSLAQDLAFAPESEPTTTVEIVPESSEARTTEPNRLEAATPVQRQLETGMISPPVGFDAIEPNIQAANAQSSAQKSGSEFQNPVVAEVEVHPESPIIHPTESETQTTESQAAIQRPALELESQPERQFETHTESPEVSTADIQPSVQRSEAKPELQKKSEVEFTSEPATVGTTEPESQITAIQPSIQASRSESGIQGKSEIGIIPDGVGVSPSKSEIQPITPQTSIQEPVIKPGTVGYEPVGQASAGISQGLGNGHPEIQASIQETGAQAESEAARIQPAIQRSQAEPEFQSVPDVEDNSELIRLNTVAGHSSVQRSQAEPEFQSVPDVEDNSELIRLNTVAGHSSVQRSQAEPKFQSVPDAGGNSESTGVNTVAGQSSVQRSQAEPKFQSVPDAGGNSESTGVNTVAGQLSVQRSQAEPQVESDFGVGSNSIEIQTKDIQFSTQKLESEPKIQSVEARDSISGSAIASTSKLEAQTTDIQPSVQKVESEIQRKSEVEIGSKLVEPIAPEPDTQTTAIQPSIQKSGVESESQAIVADRVIPALDDVRSVKSELQTADNQSSTGIQAAIQGSAVAPEFQRELGNGVNAEIAEVPATKPEIQEINSQSSIQKLEDQSKTQTGEESEVNSSTFSAEDGAVADVKSTIENATISLDESTNKNQIGEVSATQSDIKPINQTSEFGTSQQIQRQTNSNNPESVDRQPPHSTQRIQANDLQTNRTDLSNHGYPDSQRVEKVGDFNTLNAEIDQKQLSTGAPTTDSFVTIGPSETTVQRSSETGISPEPIPQLPQVWQDLSVLQPLTRKQSSEKVNTPLIQTKGYTNGSASFDFSPASIDSLSSQAFYPEVRIPAKAESSSNSLNRSGLNSNSSVGSTDAIPSAWSSLAELMDGSATAIQRSPAHNMPTDQSGTALDRSLSGQTKTMIQAQPVESSAPLQVTQNQPSVTVIARKEETVAESDNSDETVNLELIAQAIYDRLRQRMRVEQERHGRDYSGRLPW